MWRSRKGKVKITIEIDADIAGAILYLAEEAKITGEQKAAQFLKEAVWNTNLFDEPGLTSPVVQWANYLLSQTLDKGLRAC